MFMFFAEPYMHFHIHTIPLCFNISFSVSCFFQSLCLQICLFLSVCLAFFQALCLCHTISVWRQVFRIVPETSLPHCSPICSNRWNYWWSCCSTLCEVDLFCSTKCTWCVCVCARAHASVCVRACAHVIVLAFERNLCVKISKYTFFKPPPPPPPPTHTHTQLSVCV